MRIATARPSGIEWLTAKNSQSNLPRSAWSPSATSRSTGRMLCSLSFSLMNASVSREPIRGMSGRSRSRYGTPPMWSSWPWVSTMPTTLSRRSRIQLKSGRITSTPGWCSSGKRTPQSTISREPWCSKTVMLRPISPRPPEADDAQAVAGQARGLLELGVRVAHGVLPSSDEQGCCKKGGQPVLAGRASSITSGWSRVTVLARHWSGNSARWLPSDLASTSMLRMPRERRRRRRRRYAGPRCSRAARGAPAP